MIGLRSSNRITLFATALLGLAATAASAAPVQFTIDSAASTFQLTGAFNGAPLAEQTAGSGVVGYGGGPLNVEIDDVAKTITFSPTGPYALNQPADQQPTLDNWTGANYGFATPTAQLAVRGFDLYLGAEHATFNTGAPPADSQLPFFINGGTLHYQKAGQLTPTGIDLHGGGGAEKILGPITLATAGNVQTLTIPISTTFAPYMYDTGDTVNFGLSGRLVATRAVPEPGGVGLLAICGLGLLKRRRA